MKKKNIFLGVALASLSLGLAACSSNKKEPTPEPNPPVDVVNDVKVMFDTQGGNGIAYQMIKKDAKATKPADPTRTGYVFAGWYKEKDCINEFDFDSAITENTILYAKWKLKVDDVEKVSVTFDTQGGSSIETLQINKDSTVTQPANPTRNGYEFVGWKLNGEEFNFETTVENDITLIAVWKLVGSDTPEPIKYTVTFNTDGGSEINSEQVNENETLTKPTDPTKTGYTFDKWLLNGEEFDFETPINSNISLTASWIINKYTVKFDTQGGSTIEDLEVDYNGKVTKPADPTRGGYVFAGWLYKGEEFDFENHLVTDTTTIIASWTREGSDTPDPITYTVTFNSNGGTAVDAAIVDYNSAVSKPTDPTREGYTFLGWYLNDESYDFSKLVYKDIELQAKWEIKKYTVAFDTKCDLTLDSIETNHNTTITKPTDLVREGFVFNGWLLDGEEFNFETAITASITLTASWTEIEIESITVSDEDFTIYVGSEKQLTATINPTTVAASKKTITWSSSDESIATVDENGKVVGVSNGHVIITATTNNGLTDTCIIHVATYLINEDFNGKELDSKLDQWEGWSESASIYGSNNSKTNYETHYPIIKGDETDKKVELIDNGTGTAEIVIDYGYLTGNIYGSFDLGMLEVGNGWTFVQFYGQTNTKNGEVFGLRHNDNKIVYRIDGGVETSVNDPISLVANSSYHIYYEFIWNDTRQAYDVKIEINNKPYITYESGIVNLNGVKLVTADSKNYRFTVDNVKVGYIDFTLEQYKLMCKSQMEQLTNEFDEEEYTEENWTLVQSKFTALTNLFETFEGEVSAFMEEVEKIVTELYKIETTAQTELRLYKEEALSQVDELYNNNKNNYTIVKNDENDDYANSEAFEQFISNMRNAINNASSKDTVDEILNNVIDIETNTQVIERLIRDLKAEINDYFPSTDNGKTYEYNTTVITGLKNDFMTFTQENHTKVELLDKATETKVSIDNVKDDVTYLADKKVEIKGTINSNLSEAITAIEAVDASHENIQKLRDLAISKIESIDEVSTLDEINNILATWNTEYIQLKEEALLTPDEAKPIYIGYLDAKKSEIEGIYNVESDCELLTSINSIITTAISSIDVATTVKDIVKKYNDAITAIDAAIALDNLNKAKATAIAALASKVSDMTIDSSLTTVITEVVNNYNTKINECTNQVDIDTTKQTAFDIIDSIVNLFNYAKTIKEEILSNKVKEDVDIEVTNHINIIKSSISSVDVEGNYQVAKDAIDEINESKEDYIFEIEYTIKNTDITGIIPVCYGGLVDLDLVYIAGMNAVSITKDGEELTEIYDDVKGAIITVEADEDIVLSETWSSNDQEADEEKTNTVIENNLFKFLTHDNGWTYHLEDNKKYFQSSNIGPAEVDEKEQSIYVKANLSSLKLKIAVGASDMAGRIYKIHFFINGIEFDDKLISVETKTFNWYEIGFSDLSYDDVISIKLSDLNNGSRIYLSDMSAELDTDTIPKTVSVTYNGETKKYTHLETIILPTSDKYNFKNWYYLNAENEKVVVEEGTKLDAFTNVELLEELYEENVTITYMNGDNELETKTYSVWEGHTSVISGVEDPISGDLEFIGWYTDNTLTEAFDFDNVSAGQYTLYAKFSSTYTVTFESTNDVVFDSAVDSISTGKIVVGNLPKPTAEGYYFDGWYLEVALENKITEDIELSDNITLYAKWIETFVVNFDTDGGSTVENQIIRLNGNVERPATDPTKEGSNFGGWYKDEDCTVEFDFETELITEATTIYAKWDAKPTVTDSFTLQEMKKNTDYTSESGYFKLHSVDKDIKLVSDVMQNTGNNKSIKISAVNKIVVEIELSCGDSKGLSTMNGNYTLSGTGKYYNGSEFEEIDSQTVSVSKGSKITIKLEIEAGNYVELNCTKRIDIYSITATVTL